MPIDDTHFGGQDYLLLDEYHGRAREDHLLAAQRTSAVHQSGVHGGSGAVASDRVQSLPHRPPGRGMGMSRMDLTLTVLGVGIIIVLFFLSIIGR